MPDPILIGQYRLDQELGSGQFSKTYRAYDTVRHRSVALKLLPPNLLEARPAFQAFLSQAQLAAELIHPYIAWVWETGEDEGRFYIVERFVNGPSLAEQLTQSGPLPWEQARQITEQVAQALEFAYSKGWVHGSLSPRNILLGADQSAVLSDFGLQRALRSCASSTKIQFSTYDAQYLPSEVLQGSPVSPASDQYALACTLLEMLSGQAAFSAPSLAEIEQKHSAPLTQPLFPPENAPWQISRLLEQALSPDPTQRFKSAGRFIDALNHILSPGAINPAELALQEEQARAWRLAEQQARLEAEETARLAALEQARREIQEQARREVEQIELLEAEAQASLAPDDALRPAAPRRRPAHRPLRRSGWLIVSIAMILLLALGGFWLDSHYSSGSLAQPPATTPPLFPSAAPVTSAASTLIPTPSFTSTIPQPTATFTRPSTATKAPTLSPSPSLSPTLSATPSSTPTRPRSERPDARP